MTRDEAIKRLKFMKIKLDYNPDCSSICAASLVDGLEKLGLIKFEEKKSVFDIMCKELEDVTGGRTYAAIIIRELDKYGYKLSVNDV